MSEGERFLLYEDCLFWVRFGVIDWNKTTETRHDLFLPNSFFIICYIICVCVRVPT